MSRSRSDYSGRTAVTGLQVPQLDSESLQYCECVDDQSTAVTGDVTAVVGIRVSLDI